VADLNTNINIVIQNLKKVKDLGKTFKDAAKDAERIENKIKAINANLNRAKQKFNTVDPDMPRDKKGRFVKDADRNRRRNAYAELRMQKARQVTEKRSVERDLDVIQRKQRLIKREEAGALKRAQIEQKILTQRLQLSAAKGLVGRKIREAGSAGLSPLDFAGGEGKRPSAKRVELNAQVQKLKQGFQELQEAEVEVGSTTDRNGKITARNIQTYRALGSELSRVVEQLNALNRASAKRSIGFEKGRRLQERIDAIDPAKGAKAFTKPSQIATARKTAASVIAAADTGDQNLYNQALSKATAQVSRLERAYKESEKTLKEESRLRKIGAKARRRAASKRADIQGRFRESLMLGAGFPLLFGGGVGAVAGGVGGAIAQKGGKGFGAQILFSAIGQQFDKLISTLVQGMNTLGRAMNKATMNTEEVIRALGANNTAQATRIELIKKLEGPQAAFNAAMVEMKRLVGSDGVEALQKFGESTKRLQDAWTRFMTRLFAGIATLLDKLGMLPGASKGPKKYSQTAINEVIQNASSDKLMSLQTQLGNAENMSGGGRSGANNRRKLIESIKEQQKVEALSILQAQDLRLEAENRMMTIKLTTLDIEEQRKVLEDSLKLGDKEAKIQERIRQINKQLIDDKKDALTTVEQEAIANDLRRVDALEVQLALWGQIKDAIAGGLTNAIQGLIDRTKSLSDVLANVASQIASAFLSAGINALVGSISFGGAPTNAIQPAPKLNRITGNPGSRTAPIIPRATGGYVTRPEVSLIGEAGENEYVIPASKMASSMQRYSAGARGDSVVAGGGSSYAGGGAGGSTTVNYSGPILNFNSEEFVPKAAIGEIIATATARGARAGETRTLSSLQNSRSRRSTLGL
jgi:hypothetical protein